MFYTLEVFEALPWLREAVVPVAPDMVSQVQEWVREWGMSKPRVIAGGSTRHR